MLECMRAYTNVHDRYIASKLTNNEFVCNENYDFAKKTILEWNTDIKIYIDKKYNKY